MKGLTCDVPSTYGANGDVNQELHEEPRQDVPYRVEFPAGIQGIGSSSVLHMAALGEYRLRHEGLSKGRVPFVTNREMPTQRVRWRQLLLRRQTRYLLCEQLSSVLD